MVICRTEQEQRVWDAAFGAAYGGPDAAAFRIDSDSHAMRRADEAVEGLRRCILRSLRP